ncbi:MAG: adenylosuccinate synthetase [Actinomycetota bacterium]
MPVSVVVGTQWGDEGKAKIIDLLAESHKVVARFQGGHNAGHTVVVGTEKYALQLVPSGVFYSHVTPVIGNGVVVDLPTLFKEIDTLESRGITCSRLKVSSLAHLIFPWHQAHDAISESSLGENKIGTTLKGIGPAYADKSRRVGIRVGDVRDSKRFKQLVRDRAIAEQKVLTALGGEQLKIDEIVENFAALGDRLKPYVSDTVNFLHDVLEHNENLLLEGAQATFLDIDHGTYPFVTSSNPISGGACAGTGLGPRDITRVVGIAKAYTTRVGSGPFPSELLGELGDKIVEIGREFGTVTGRRRRPGWLDLVMLRHAVRLNSLTEIALTKLDILDTFEIVRVCIGYELNGKELSGYPDDAQLLGQVIPKYVDLPGWKKSVSSVRHYADLPSQAKALIELVENHVGVPVSIIGVGPERNECVVR